MVEGLLNPWGLFQIKKAGEVSASNRRCPGSRHVREEMFLDGNANISGNVIVSSGFMSKCTLINCQPVLINDWELHVPGGSGSLRSCHCSPVSSDWIKVGICPSGTPPCQFSAFVSERAQKTAFQSHASVAKTNWSSLVLESGLIRLQH